MRDLYNSAMRTTINLPDTLHAIVSSLAHHTGRSLSDTVEELVVADYEALRAAHEKSELAARNNASEAAFGDWIAAQNERFEAQAIPGAELRPW